jgi:hypothetical protein
MVSIVIPSVIATGSVIDCENSSLTKHKKIKAVIKPLVFPAVYGKTNQVAVIPAHSGQHKSQFINNN